MTENDNEALSLRDTLRQKACRFYWRRVQLMRTDWAYRQNNGRMIFGGILAFLFCVMWLFIIDDSHSSHRFDLGFNLFFGIGAIVFGLAAGFGVKMWIDSKNSN